TQVSDLRSSRIASAISRWVVTRSRVFSPQRAHGHPGLEGGDRAEPRALSMPTRDEWHPEFESVPRETAVAHDRRLLQRDEGSAIVKRLRSGKRADRRPRLR